MNAPRITEFPSPNCGKRPEGAVIDMLVLHYTGMETAEAALDRLCDPAAKVSAHYVIDEDGALTRLVAEPMRAWHAGISAWRGASDINDRSIGIELVNPGHEFGYRRFPEPQIAATIELARGIVERHPIPVRNVVGHSDIAPERKTDPGELFDWRRLARAGIGLWPESEAGTTPPPAEGIATALLGEIGYGVDGPGGKADEPSDTATIAAIRAFQRHYRPGQIDGRLDAETAGLIRGLASLIAATG